MHARYADGRHALTNDVEVELGADELTIRTATETHTWTYAELARADDGNGHVIFKRKPDTGERLVFATDAEAALKAAAPKLFTPRAHGVEPPVVTGSVVAVAWALAAA